MILIRRLKPEDAQTLSEMIAITLRTTNVKDYSETYIEKIVQRMEPDCLLESAAGRHFYVAEEDGRIVGCGAIGPYHKKERRKLPVYRICSSGLSGKRRRAMHHGGN